jgi:GNAT superfamily N-acetyltransferase
MLATPITLKQSSRSGPRPIDLSRDVPQILRLLDVSFGPLLEGQGRRLLSERTNLSYNMPFQLRLSMFTRGFIPGFIWEEEGQIVGNISILESKLTGRYLIANMVIHPDHRQQGLGKGLMGEAVDHIKHQGGREILLQVEHDNTAAISLYNSLGFDTLGTMNRWVTTVERLRLLADSPDSTPTVRRLRRDEWREAFLLDQTSVDPELNWPLPPTRDKYKTELWRSIGNFLNGRRVETWVVSAPVDPGARPGLAGLTTINNEWGRPYMVDIRVLPAWCEKLSRPLLVKTTRRLKRMRGGTIQLSHPADDGHINQMLLEANFRKKRTLSVMHHQLDT